MYVWMYGWKKVSWIKGLIGLFRYNEIANNQVLVGIDDGKIARLVG